MHSPGHHQSQSPTNRGANRARPRLKVHTSDQNDLVWMADDSEKMRYPPNSPAKKRNPWSPSKTMMQSPSKEEQAAVESSRWTRWIAAPPFAGGGSGQRRKKPKTRVPVSPYSASNGGMGTESGSGKRRSMLTMLWRRGSFLAMGLLMTTAALHRWVAVNLFTSMPEAEVLVAPPPDGHKLRSTGGTRLTAVHGEERRAQQESAEDDASALRVEENGPTTSKHAVPAKQSPVQEDDAGSSSTTTQHDVVQEELPLPVNQNNNHDDNDVVKTDKKKRIVKVKRPKIDPPVRKENNNDKDAADAVAAHEKKRQKKPDDDDNHDNDVVKVDKKERIVHVKRPKVDPPERKANNNEKDAADAVAAHEKKKQKKPDDDESTVVKQDVGHGNALLANGKKHATVLDSKADENGMDATKEKLESNQKADPSRPADKEDTITAKDVVVNDVEGSSSRTSRFAYAYIVGGCDPKNPTYIHFLHNIAMSTYLQRQEGSKQDVIVFVQMSYASTHDALPDSDLSWLTQLQIQVRYLPKNKHESFDQLMLRDKLPQVLRLTEYERVLFADADMLLRGSLDYLFDLSVASSSSAGDGNRGPLLQPNVVFANRRVPASGGLFLVAPDKGDYEAVQVLLAHHLGGGEDNDGNDSDLKLWDAEKGWGHAMEERDYYELISGKKGRHWDFMGAFADEGLLYNWVKYEKKAVSLVMRDNIQNWGIAADGTLALLETLDFHIFDGSTTRDCWSNIMSHKPCTAPHSDYIHYAGRLKPWLVPPQEFLAEGTTANDSPNHFWYYTLQKMNGELNMGIDFENWSTKRPLLGLHANNMDAVAVVFPSTADETSKSMAATSKFAVAYVVGGCDPDKPAYRNFLQDILVNTHLQRQDGSKADVVVFIQMLFHSKFDSLPKEELRWLNAMDIKIEMIPKSEDESFDQIMMEKFRILDLNQYDRVLFLDADIMVRGSLDYLFDLSKSGTLKRNMIFADEYAPAAGSIFMVTPAEGDWDLILDIVREKEERGASLPYPHWDESVGWGHKFKDGDSYELIDGKKDSSWDFLGSSSDLGLLYYWVKYKEKSVSIILKDSVQHWDADDKGIVHLESTVKLDDVFGGHSSQRKCWKGSLNGKPCAVPHSDIVHFTSTKKPWLHSPPKVFSGRSALDSPMHLWYHTLSGVNEKLGMGLNFTDWTIKHRPLLGMHPNAIEAVVSVPGTAAVPNGSQEQTAADFAYAYVIGGCKPEDPSYLYYFYDILINTYLQRGEGSKADVVVFVQMSFQSAYDALPDKDLRLFNTMNIKVEYIPKAEDESFYRIMIDKFLTLGLTQYKRVLFLDGDILTRGSMDYLFDLSIQGKLQENVVFAGSDEPANGGTFMVAPKEGSWDRVLDIIQQKEERGAALPYPHWNETIGWGHVIEEDDYLQKLSKKKAQSWDFYGSFADQGLLYHWVKYEEKSVSIVFRDDVQHWAPGKDGKVHLLNNTGLDVFNQGSVKPVERHDCWKSFMKHKPCLPPHSDFVHFTGNKKPWLGGPPKDFGIASENESAKHYWFYVLDILNKKLEMNLDFDNWKKGHRPSLGLFPKQEDVAKTSYASSK